MNNLQRYTSTPNLLVRPYPFRTEGPKGYQLRVAQDNWMTIPELLGLGVHYDLNVLKFHGLMPREGYDQDLYEHVHLVSNLLSGKPRIWNHQQPRFCPICLNEDAHWRFGWELLFHDACPQHGVWLIDQCSSCGDKLSWNRESIVRCQCGSDLRTEQAGACPDAVARIADILAAKLTGIQKSIYEPLEDTDIEQSQRLIRYLGAYMNPAAGRNPLKINKAALMSSSWQITSLAAEILNDWPNAFEKSLDRIQAEADPSESRKLGSVFGYAYHYLYRGLKGDAFNKVREAFENWLNISWRGGLAKRNRRLAYLMLEKANWIPAAIARDELGISHQFLQHLIREQVIEGEESTSDSGRKFLMVRRDQLHLVKELVDGGINMRMAGEALGLNKKRLRQILTKLFPNARKQGQAMTVPWSIPVSEIEAILNTCHQLQRLIIPDEHSISLAHILKYMAWTNDEIVNLINAVMDGDVHLSAYLEDSRGINGWIFDRKDLERWRIRHSQGFGTWLSVPELAKYLRLKQQVVYELVHNNFISSEVLHKQPRGGLRVKRVDADQFMKKYIFCVEVAETLGVSSNKAKSLLAEMGIKPESGPDIDQSRQYFYRRNDDLERAIGILNNPKKYELR